MSDFKYINDRGLIIAYSSEVPDEYHKDDLRNRKRIAANNLKDGPGFTGERDSRGRKKKVNEEDFYIENITDYLLIPKDDFEYDKGGSAGLRTKLDFLQDKISQQIVLEREFGEENVDVINIKGDQRLFYRDPEAKKWRSLDPLGFDLGDMTTDIAGDIFPIGASIIAGTSAFLTTAPAGIGSAGAVPILATATASSAAEGAVGGFKM